MEKQREPPMAKEKKNNYQINVHRSGDGADIKVDLV